MPSFPVNNVREAIRSQAEDRSLEGSGGGNSMNGQRDPSVGKERTTVGLLEVGIVVGLLALVYYLATHDIFPTSLNVRAPRPEDHAPDECYFPFDPAMKARNLAVVEGTFTMDTFLTARYYLVQSGVAEEKDRTYMKRSPNVINSPSRMTLHIRLALGEEDTPKGRQIKLGHCGESRGGGCGGDTICLFEAKFRCLLEGPLAPGGEHIIYVEGDRACIVDRQMSIEDFARSNAGNHLVVLAEVH